MNVAVDHIAPLAVNDGVVAQQNMGLAVVDLVEVGDGLEIAVEGGCVLVPGVVVAPDQVLVSRQAGEQLVGNLPLVIPDIAHQIHGVVQRYRFVPIADQRLVHLLHCGKGPGGQQRLIEKVKIGGIKNHGQSSSITLYL